MDKLHKNCKHWNNLCNEEPCKSCLNIAITKFNAKSKWELKEEIKMKVRCIDDFGLDGELKKGKIYEAIKKYPGTYYLIGDDFINKLFNQDRFEIVEEYKESGATKIGILTDLKIKGNFSNKPPIGIMPEELFEIGRVKDLCRALHDYTQQEEVDLNLIKLWAYELLDRLDGLHDKGVF